tara:strand:+ start:582 stop:815 length:234 start_codon:yes stop_codon:yes gene_type:complete
MPLGLPCLGEGTISLFLSFLNTGDSFPKVGYAIGNELSFGCFGEDFTPQAVFMKQVNIIAATQRIFKKYNMVLTIIC